MELYEKWVLKIERIYKKAMKQYEKLFHKEHLQIKELEEIIEELKKAKDDGIRQLIEKLFLNYIKLNTFEEKTQLLFSENDFISDMLNEFYKIIYKITRWDKKDELLSLYELEKIYVKEENDLNLKVKTKKEKLKVIVDILMFYYEKKNEKKKIVKTNLSIFRISSGGITETMADFRLKNNDMYSFIRFYITENPLSEENIEFYRKADKSITDDEDFNLREYLFFGKYNPEIPGIYFSVEGVKSDFLVKQYLEEIKRNLEKELDNNKYKNGPLWFLQYKLLYQKICDYERAMNTKI